jgi:hypothetical protein
VDRLCGLVIRIPGYRSRGPGFDSRRYHIFSEVVGLERGPLSLVRITEELLEWKSSGFDLENREYGPGDPLRWPRNTLYPQKSALNLPTSGGHRIGIVPLGAKVTEFIFCFVKQKRRRYKTRFWIEHIGKTEDRIHIQVHLKCKTIGKWAVGSSLTIWTDHL